MKARFSHQTEAKARLNVAFGAQKPGYILAHAMRAGKSRVCVEFIDEKLEAREVERVVIVCPASVRKNWQREFRKWADIDAVVVGPGKAVDISGPGVFIVSYELAKRFKYDSGIAEIEILVLDEVHFISSEKSLRSGYVRGMVSERTFVVGLTGTPIPNTVRDLWNQVDTVVPGALGSCGGFIVKYSNKIECEYSPSGFRYSGLNPAKAVELQNKLAPFWHRVTKQEFAHLLPKFDIVPRFVSPKRTKIDWDNEDAFEDLLALNSPLKLDTMMEVLDEAIEGGQKKFCVAAWLHQTNDQVSELCRARGWDVYCVDGRVPSDKRLEVIDSWILGERVSVLVAGIGAVGIGLSLSASETSVMVEIPWRPETLSQFVARFNDAENSHASQLVPIVVDGSREERAINSYVTKQAEIDMVIAPSSDEQKAKAAFAKVDDDETILRGLL